MAIDERVRVIEEPGDNEFRIEVHGEEGPVQIPDLLSLQNVVCEARDFSNRDLERLGVAAVLMLVRNFSPRDLDTTAYAIGKGLDAYYLSPPAIEDDRAVTAGVGKAINVARTCARENALDDLPRRLIDLIK